MRCTNCDQAERVPVRRAKMVERDGHVAVVSDVPMEECPSCGERWMTIEVAEQLDVLLRKPIESGAEAATGHWDAFVTSAT